MPRIYDLIVNLRAPPRASTITPFDFAPRAFSILRIGFYPRFQNKQNRRDNDALN